MSEERRAMSLIQELCREFPARRACSYQERAAQERIRDEALAAGAEANFERFRFNLSLYETIALHFGLGVVATLLTPSMPLVGATLHLLVAVSYWADASRNGHILRRLLPQRDSQNLLVRLPAAGVPKLRIVLPAHVDASFTGRIFDPRVLRLAGGGRTGETQPYHARSLELATDAQFLLGLLALARVFFGADGTWFRALELVVAVPGILAFLANAEVVLRDETVQGAADNLSGVAANLLLLDRFREDPLPDVELVFAFTGCEEAGTGGAWHLVRAHEGQWSPEDTVVIGVDTVCNGELRWFEEGEMARVPVPERLAHTLRRVSGLDERLSRVRRFRIPVGATDAMPFLAKGYEAVTIGCVDIGYGAPRHYHHPSDTPENVDPSEIVLAVDFIEAVVRVLALERCGDSAPAGSTL